MRHTGRLLLVVAIGLLAFAWSVFAQEATPEVVPTRVSLIGMLNIAFPISAALGTNSFSGDQIEGREPQDTDPYPAGYPDYRVIDFIGYRVRGSEEQTWRQPRLYVYPAAEYAAVNALAAVQIEALRTLLDERPALESSTETLTPGSLSLPFLPPNVASFPLFNGRPKYLEFENGAGVRYLTLLTQQPAPVDSSNLLYTFQGLTDDGMYYVSLILPLNIPALDVVSRLDTLSGDEYAAYLQNEYWDYLASAIAALDALPQDAFTPDLDELDTVLRWLIVGTAE
jgi:hypothetical protein